MSLNPPAQTPRHAWLYALPGAAMPSAVECAGRILTHRETFKHDFFAATGLYEDAQGQVVVKINRVQGLGGIPLQWIGWFLARREIRHYQVAQGIEGIPALIGPVGATGMAHAFVPGCPLGRYEAVNDQFFDRLEAMLAELHRRDMAYVDLNKRQNILLGEDGRPHLIDFQISLWLPARGWGRLSLLRWFLARFQHGDNYHFLKHKRRLRPDLLREGERLRVERVSIWIRIHRAWARPVTYARRALLRWLRRGETVKVAGSDAK